jgi:membrane-associated phospholipid phosphatase
MTTRTAAALTVVGGLVGTAAVYAYFVRTAAGQRLDAQLVPRHGFYAADRLLAAYDRHVVIAELVVLTSVILIAAHRRQLIRGLLSAAMPLAVVVVVNVAKVGLPRPAFGTTGSTHNSFPSGHVALAAGTVIALCLVVPITVRIVVGAAGAVAVALVLVATIAAGWHRFSDGMGAILISVAAGGLVVATSPLRVAGRRSAGSREHPHGAPSIPTGSSIR